MNALQQHGEWCVASVVKDLIDQVERHWRGLGSPPRETWEDVITEAMHRAIDQSEACVRGKYFDNAGADAIAALKDREPVGGA